MSNYQMMWCSKEAIIIIVIVNDVMYILFEEDLFFKSFISILNVFIWLKIMKNSSCKMKETKGKEKYIFWAK